MPRGLSSALNRGGEEQEQIAETNSTVNILLGRQKSWMHGTAPVIPTPRAPITNSARCHGTTLSPINVLPSPSPSDDAPPTSGTYSESPALMNRVLAVANSHEQASEEQTSTLGTAPLNLAYFALESPLSQSRNVDATRRNGHATIAGGLVDRPNSTTNHDERQQTGAAQDFMRSHMNNTAPAQSVNGIFTAARTSDVATSALPRMTGFRPDSSSTEPDPKRRRLWALVDEQTTPTQSRYANSISINTPIRSTSISGQGSTPHRLPTSDSATHQLPSNGGLAAQQSLVQQIDHQLGQYSRWVVQYVASRPQLNDFERTWFVPLVDACKTRDILYLVFWQQYCLWVVTRGRFAAYGGSPAEFDAGFRTLQEAIPDLGSMGIEHARCCAQVPLIRDALLDPQSPFGASVFTLTTFLQQVAQRLQALLVTCQTRKAPFLVSELLEHLNCRSGVLQMLLFRASVFRVGVTPGPVLTDLDTVFMRDREAKRHTTLGFTTSIIPRTLTDLHKDPENQRIYTTYRTIIMNWQQTQMATAQVLVSPMAGNVQQGTERRGSAVLPRPGQTVSSYPTAAVTSQVSSPNNQNLQQFQANIRDMVALSQNARPHVTRLLGQHSRRTPSLGHIDTTTQRPLQQARSSNSSTSSGAGVADAQNFSLWPQSSTLARPTGAQQPTQNVQEAALAQLRGGYHNSRLSAAANQPHPVHQGQPQQSSRPDRSKLLMPAPGNVIERHQFGYEWEKKSVLMSLHQARARSPTRVKEPSHVENPERMYQAVTSLAVGPLELETTALIQHLDFDVNSADYSALYKESVPAGSLLPVQQFCNDALRYRLRCCRFEQKQDGEPTDAKWAIADTEWPNNIFMKFNSKALVIRRKAANGRDLAVELTGQIVRGSNRLSVSMFVANNNNNTESMMQHYYLAVEVITVSSHSNLMKQITTHNIIKPEDTLNNIKTRIIAAAGEEESLAITDRHGNAMSELRIDLRDPFSFKACNIPIRGVDCKHLECFDLQVWLNTRRAKDQLRCSHGPTCRMCLVDSEVSNVDRWKCPICFADARPVSLRMDGYLCGVLEQFKPKDHEQLVGVTVSADGSVRPNIDKDEGDDEGSDGENARQSTTGTNRVVEIIELDDE